MSINERRLREKERRRQDIISAAEKVFFQKGYEEATMDDVAEKAELSKGTLYLYFKSKQEVLLALAVWHIGFLNEEYKSILEDKIDGYSQVEMIGRAYFDFFMKRPNLLPLLAVIETITKKAVNETRSMKEWLEQSERSFNALHQAFINGKNDGSISQDIDPFKTTLLFGVVSKAVCRSVLLEEDVLKSLGADSKDFFEYSFTFLGKSIIKKE